MILPPHFRWVTYVIAGLGLTVAAGRAATTLSIQVQDPKGAAVPDTLVRVVRRGDLSRREGYTDGSGLCAFGPVSAGDYRVVIEKQGFPVVERNLVISETSPALEVLQFSTVAASSESITVAANVADLGLFAPDPAQRLLVRDQTLDANPGRPGMPVSIPGFPVESPAGGVKPPQYFAPGVAGDHGEPIAMFFHIGGYLFQNNLPANAHGNGYSDPNVIIPIAIESVQTDGGAFNVREGNNSVNAAIVLGLRDRLEPTLRITADSRDVNLVAGWSPRDPTNRMWIGTELSYGNGFLERLEHRKQFKGNVSKVFTFGKHYLTAYGIGYYGFAYQPGLIPIDVPTPNDTIDSRQREDTSNGALILNDVWQVTAKRQFQFSGFYRYYTLDVRPNFGDGLIRQSERRNVNGEDALYTEHFSRSFSLLAGVDLRREAPRSLNLDRFDDQSGSFAPVTSNNLTINFRSPYVAADGYLLPFLHYNAGYRSDFVSFDNQDLYRPEISFHRNATVSSPKGTLSFLPLRSMPYLPVISLSYGQSFHVNDPRIGTTAVFGGTIVSKARSYQLVVEKTIAKTEFRTTVLHVTTAQQLARISNDTGLQEDQGPGLLRSITITARRNFGRGFFQGLWARADARDRFTGEATPEAPRLIWGVLGTLDRLPFHLVCRAEYDHVGRKPLGDGFNAVPVREFRGALVRSFESKGIDVGLNVFLASGFGGETLETFALPGESGAFERITGFPLRSYATASVTYRFRRRMR